MQKAPVCNEPRAYRHGRAAICDALHDYRGFAPAAISDVAAMRRKRRFPQYVPCTSLDGQRYLAARGAVGGMAHPGIVQVEFTLDTATRVVRELPGRELRGNAGALPSR